MITVLCGMRDTGDASVFEVDSGHNLGGRFLSVALRRVDHPALLADLQSFSYRTIADASLRVASFLLGDPRFRPGCSVAVLAGNTAEYLAAFYGTLIAGGVVVPLPERLERSRLAQMLDDSDARIVLTAGRLAGEGNTFAGHRVERVDIANYPIANVETFTGVTTVEDSPALILYTSGSSGKPKGVLLSHGNLLANTQSILNYLPIRQSDRALALLPFCHAYGNSVVQTHLLAGATLVVAGSTTFPNTVVDAMQRHAATSFAAVPELYYALIACSELDRRRLTALRYMTVAGGALRRDAALQMAELISPAQFIVMYGQTEATARLAYLPHDQLARRPNSIGKAIPDVELQVQDPDGQAVRCGAQGELCARGPNVMLGYWKDEQSTARTVQDGWLRTGDLATVDQDGYFFLAGRRNDQVKIRGMKVRPRDVADVLSRRLPACQVAVVPFSRNDVTQLALFLAPNPGGLAACDDVNSFTAPLPRGIAGEGRKDRGAVSPLSLRESGQIRRICQETLARHEWPSHIEIVEQLPLTDSLKIDFQSLSERAARACGSVDTTPWLAAS